MIETIFAIPGALKTATGGFTYDRRVLELLPALGVSASYLELPETFPFPSEKDIEQTFKALGETAPDATLLIDGLVYGALPAERVAALNRRIIALVHHPLAWEHGLSQTQIDTFTASEMASLKVAAGVICTSPATARLLQEHFDVAPEKITIAEPGTDPTHRATGTGTPMQLLSVGAVSPRKGYEVLVEALAPLKALDWRATIVGALDRSPEAVAALEKKIAAHGLGDRVTLAGVVVPATLDRYYNSTDLLVMPSLFEGYGMVLAEAMARGLPIVCTTGGAAAETVPDAAALKVPPGDVAALTEAIERALGDRKLRMRLEDASWEAGRKLPTWNETARRVAAVLLGMAP